MQSSVPANPVLLLLLLPALGLLAMLQGTLGNQLALFQVKPNFLLLLVLIWTVMRGRREGMVVAFVGGFWLDFLALVPLGISSVALITASYIVGMGRRGVAVTHYLIPLGVALVGTSVYILVFHLLLALHQGTWAWMEELRANWHMELFYQSGLMFLFVPLWRYSQQRLSPEAIHVG